MGKKKQYQKTPNGDVLILPIGTDNGAILARAKQEWTARHLRADGTLDKNNYAPVYVRLGDANGERVMALRLGAEMILYREAARVPLTLRTVVS